jgi:hypothetical protein
VSSTPSRAINRTVRLCLGLPIKPRRMAEKLENKLENKNC